jgi:AcrR family transcriptional regulator
MEVNKLAKRLGVSRGGFYWFFKNSEQLRDELLAYWERTSTVQFEGILRRKGRNGIEEFRALVNLWIDEEDYKPAWDAAIRDWARTSAKVARVVHRVDDQRIAVIHQVFRDMGYQDPEALVRARITYYHQVGYYALGVRQARKDRLRLLPYYIRALIERG